MGGRPFSSNWWMCVRKEDRFVFARGQVVCVRFIERGEEIRVIWDLGVILDIEYFTLERRYVVSVPSTPRDIAPRRERHVKLSTENVERCGTMVLSDNPLVLLFARLSSRTFLRAFGSGKVLKWRKVHRVPEDQLCLPDPQVLYRRIFS